MSGFGFQANQVITLRKSRSEKLTTTMIPRKPPRVWGNIFPKPQIGRLQGGPAPNQLTAEKSEGVASSLKRQNRIKQGEGDPKLAGAILELAQGCHQL
jgi:hypothetical protein